MYRTTLIPHASSIINICTHIIGAINGNFSQMQMESASMIIAHIKSMETAENWLASFDAYSKELLPVLVSLGLVNAKTPSLSNMSINETALLQNSLCSSFYQNKSNRGASKVMTLKRCYYSFCKILVHMISLGCTTGAVALDVSSITSIITTVITTSLDASPDDPRNKIENEYGVSRYEVSMILSQLKVHSMTVVKALLGIQQPILNRISSHICRIYFLASSSVIL
jgi:hypothetical protein